ncbi:MAG: SoxR reducing system RseC family protein [Proteobacteria bacterium]|nr:SoxR reducing system RseC family protein [Pseudomonadota bacterium]
MIKQKATVIATDDTTVWLDTERQSTCSQCQVKKGCGTGMLANHVGKRFSRISVEKQGDVTVGQQVQLGIPEESLLQGALMMYMTPLVMMFLSAALAQVLDFNEIMEIVTGFVGLAIGFYWVHIQFKNNNAGLQAKIVEE